MPTRQARADYKAAAATTVADNAAQQQQSSTQQQQINRQQQQSQQQQYQPGSSNLYTGPSGIAATGASERPSAGKHAAPAGAC